MTSHDAQHPDALISVPGGVIRWEDPPPNEPGRTARPGRRAWAIVALQLRTRPGVWALVDVDTDASAANRIRRGRSWFAPAGTFEAVQRKVNGVLCCYARYVGDTTERASTPATPPEADR